MPLPMAHVDAKNSIRKINGNPKAEKHPEDRGVTKGAEFAIRKAKLV